MFGYIRTDIPYLYLKDNALYKASYCGLCKSIGRTCGQKARFSLNYDMTFLSIFTHCVLGVDFDIKKSHCITHFIRKRSMARPDSLSDRIAALNVIMAYYKLSDDVLDSGKGRFSRSLIKRAYKKAKKLEPKLDKIVHDGYADLLMQEKLKCTSIDVVSDCFANIVKFVLKELLLDRSSEYSDDLGYALGKWIYLIDAIDDYDKDKKSSNYNPFIERYSLDSRADLFKSYGEEVTAIFNDLLIVIEDSAKKIDYKFNHDLIDNILFRGIRKKTFEVLGRNK